MAMHMTRKKAFFAAALALAAAVPLAADVLVWNTGVRMLVRESLADLDRAQSVAAVTVIDSEGRLAPVWIRPSDLDWERSLAASQNGEAPTTGNAGLRMETIPAKAAAASAAPVHAPSGDVVALNVKGRMLYGDRLVSGTIRNETRDTLVNIRVRAVCVNRHGKTVASAWGNPKTEALVPGQEAHFEIIVRGDGMRYVEDQKIEVAYDVFEKSE
jgi:hypothetical protein